MRELTNKQKHFVEEYLKTFNACEAVRRAYPDIKTYNAIRSMSGKLMVEKGRVKMAIEERLNTVLGSKEEKIALAERVIGKLKNAFEECKQDKDLDKLGRTLLEVAGVIGGGNKVNVGIAIGDRPCSDCPHRQPLFADPTIEADAKRVIDMFETETIPEAKTNAHLEGE